MLNRSISVCLVLFSILLLGSLADAGVAQTTDASIEQFIKIRWPRSVKIGLNQNMYFIYDPDGVRQLYKVPAGETQKDAEKITSFEDGIDDYSLSEDGRWIVVYASEGGSEQSDLYLYSTVYGTLKPVLKDPKVVYGSVVWKRNSQGFAFRANDTSPSDFHVYYFNLANEKHRLLHAGKGYHYPVDFSMDGEKLMVGRYNSASHSQLFEVGVLSGTLREITPKDEKWSFDPIGYTTNDNQFLVNTNYHGDLKSVHLIDLLNGTVKPVLPALSGKQVDFAAIHPRRNVLAVAVNADGYRTLHLHRTYDFASMEAPLMDKGIVSNLAFNGQYMLYSLENARSPGIVHHWNFNTPHLPSVAVTEADTQGIDLSTFHLPELVHYPSFDGTKIPAFVYLPPNHKKGQKIPFIVQYHGGPESQYRPWFNRSFQYLMSQGYGIIAPNVRGSSGYGKAYIEADNYKNRMVSVKDGIWAARYVIDQGYTEPKKIGAWGGSYGGFMTMAVITEAPELFGAACNVVGIVNFETFLKQTKAYRRHLREAEYGPLSDPEFLKSISPIYKVDRITTPLMVAHGENDPRVPVGEARQVAAALKKRGIKVEELYFDDEGHGFAKEANRLVYYKKLAKFFDEHLKK